MKYKVTKINFEQPRRKVQDWDDRMSVVTWKDTTMKDPTAIWPKKEKVRSKMAKQANPAFTTITPSLPAEQLLLPLDIGQPWGSPAVHSRGEVDAQ